MNQQNAPRIGIIGGGGWLGSAIVQGLIADGVVPPGSLTLSWRSIAPSGPAGAFLTQDNRELARRSDVIILSVRPEDWKALDVPAQGKLVVSVMAGVPLAAIAVRHGTRRVVRALPNAAAEVGASFTPFFAAPDVTEADRAVVHALLAPCGTVDEVATEDQIDYFAGLTGTGPAYPALMALAMERDAVAQGIDPAVARRAVRAIFVGTGRLLEADARTAEDIVDAFVAYRGMTAAGLAAMAAAGLEQAVRAGITAALSRQQQMTEEG